MTKGVKTSQNKESFRHRSYTPFMLVGTVGPHLPRGTLRARIVGLTHLGDVAPYEPTCRDRGPTNLCRVAPCGPGIVGPCHVAPCGPRTVGPTTMRAPGQWVPPPPCGPLDTQDCGSTSFVWDPRSFGPAHLSHMAPCRVHLICVGPTVL